MTFAIKRPTPPSDYVQNALWQSGNDSRWFLNKNKFEKEPSWHSKPPPLHMKNHFFKPSLHSKTCLHLTKTDHKIDQSDFKFRYEIGQ